MQELLNKIIKLLGHKSKPFVVYGTAEEIEELQVLYNLYMGERYFRGIRESKATYLTNHSYSNSNCVSHLMRGNNLERSKSEITLFVRDFMSNSIYDNPLIN